jgi:hypothetical protein
VDRFLGCLPEWSNPTSKPPTDSFGLYQSFAPIKTVLASKCCCLGLHPINVILAEGLTFRCINTAASMACLDDAMLIDGGKFWLSSTARRQQIHCSTKFGTRLKAPLSGIIKIIPFFVLTIVLSPSRNLRIYF